MRVRRVVRVWPSRVKKCPPGEEPVLGAHLDVAESDLMQRLDEDPDSDQDVDGREDPDRLPGQHQGGSDTFEVVSVQTAK